MVEKDKETSHDGHTLNWLDKDDNWRSVKLPFSPSKTRTWQGSWHKGRGLLLDVDGNPQLTTDGGHSFVQLEPPPTHFRNKGIYRNLLCGTSRCVIDGIAVTAGWKRPPLAPTKPTKGLIGRGKQVMPAKPRAARTNRSALRIQCEPTKTNPVVKLPAKANDNVLTLSWGLGTALFSGTLAVEHVKNTALRNSAGLRNRYFQQKVTVFELQGMADGSLRQRRIHRGRFIATHKGHRGIAVAPAHAGRVLWWRHIRPAHEGLYDPIWSTGVKTRVKPLPKTNWSETIVLATPRGALLIDVTKSRAIMLHADGRVKTRPWPSNFVGLFENGSLGRSGRSLVVRGMAAERKNGNWVVAMKVSDELYEDTAERRLWKAKLWLVEIPKNGDAQARPLASSASIVSLSQDADGVYLVLDEVIGQRQRIWRARPVSRDLQLGKHFDLPGTTHRFGSTVHPPACSVDGDGSLITVPFRDLTWVQNDSKTMATIKDVKAQLLLRPKSVCVRRVAGRTGSADYQSDQWPDAMMIASDGRGAAVALTHTDDDNEFRKPKLRLLRCRHAPLR